MHAVCVGLEIDVTSNRLAKQEIRTQISAMLFVCKIENTYLKSRLTFQFACKSKQPLTCDRNNAKGPKTVT